MSVTINHSHTGVKTFKMVLAANVGRKSKFAESEKP